MIRNDIILALAQKWEAEANEQLSLPKKDSDEAKAMNSRLDGMMEQKRICAKHLFLLIDILGQPEDNDSLPRIR